MTCGRKHSGHILSWLSKHSLFYIGFILTTTHRQAFYTIRCLPLLLIALIISAPAGGAKIFPSPVEPESTYAEPDTNSFLGRALNVELGAWGWVYLPRVYYATERGMGFGGEIVHDFPWLNKRSSIDASDISFEGQATTKGQGRAESTADIRWGNGAYNYRTKINFANLARKYYGIGPDTPFSNEEIYQPQDLRVYMELFRRLFWNLKLGLRYEFEYYKLLEYAQNGLLHSPAILNMTGKALLGAGPLLQWDNRNRKYSPTSGFYYQAFALFFDDELGSEVDFNNFNIDLRHYIPLPGDHVLATQVFVYGARGRVPFWRLAEMGGRAHTRGYRRGRYRDNILLSFQGEYRFPLWRRFETAVFAGLSSVSPSFSTIKPNLFEPTYGGGLRFRIKSPDGIRARFDVAGGNETVRVYFSLDEAF